ncbi:IS110 family transposase, partial [Klebsiella michiganensis]
MTDTPPAIAESIENVLSNLSAELEHLDDLILTHLDRHPELKKDFDLLTSIKSVGFQLGLNMLVILRSHRFDTAERSALTGRASRLRRSDGVHDQHTAL